MSEVDQGVCALCGQELLLTEDDCWHPYTVKKVCPPEPVGHLERQAWHRAGNRTGRPGREHWRLPSAVGEGPYFINFSLYTGEGGKKFHTLMKSYPFAGDEVILHGVVYIVGPRMSGPTTPTFFLFKEREIDGVY